MSIVSQCQLRISRIGTGTISLSSSSSCGRRLPRASILVGATSYVQVLFGQRKHTVTIPHAIMFQRSAFRATNGLGRRGKRTLLATRNRASAAASHFGGRTKGTASNVASGGAHGTRMMMDLTFACPQFTSSQVRTGGFVSRGSFRTFLSAVDGDEANDSDDGG